MELNKSKTNRNKNELSDNIFDQYSEAINSNQENTMDNFYNIIDGKDSSQNNQITSDQNRNLSSNI